MRHGRLHAALGVAIGAWRLARVLEMKARSVNLSGGGAAMINAAAISPSCGGMALTAVWRRSWRRMCLDSGYAIDIMSEASARHIIVLKSMCAPSYALGGDAHARRGRGGRGRAGSLRANNRKWRGI